MKKPPLPTYIGAAPRMSVVIPIVLVSVAVLLFLFKDDILNYFNGKSSN